MSAAILMTDSWQPTVLQLMPFSNNNASQKCLPSFSDGQRTFAKSRGFPTLAVTRSRSTRNVGKPVRVSSERMPRTHPVSGRSTPPPRARSEYGSRVRGALVTPESSYLANNVNKTTNRTPDISDAIHSTECIPTGDGLPRNVKLLTKPSPCNGFDGRYFLPQNGFWKSITMTPGEMELQKHRVILNKEQNRCKKYKLNVNQLPRSTTPINDNDPDKLNMKQVIRFLQTREGDAPAVDPGAKKSDRRVKSGYPSSTAPKISVRNSSEREEVYTHHSASPLRREVTTVVYDSNLPESPLIKNRWQKSNRDGIHGDEATSKSVDGNRSFKSTREFRLHRFLTMAPNPDEVSAVNPTRQIHPISAQRRLVVTETSKSLDCGHESSKNGYGPVLHYSRQGERYPKMQYRLPNRRTETAFQTYESTKRFHSHTKRSAEVVTEGVIRLPSMLDFNNESDNDDDDIMKARLRIRDLRSVSISSECMSIEANARDSDSPISMKDFPSDSDSSSKPVSRKVTVSIPREIVTDDRLTTTRSTDPVRLVLRQESSLTRESTYMSDMATHRSDCDTYGLSSPFSTHSNHPREKRFDDE